MAPIFISPENEAGIFLYFNIIFGCSILLHALSFYLLIKHTPPTQRVVRKYLIVIQIALLANDIQFDIGLHGIPLFPVLAGYGSGLFLKMGMSVQLALAILLILYIYIALSITMCIFHRHQTVVLPGNSFRFKEKTRAAIEVLLPVLVPIPSITWAIVGQDKATIHEIIRMDAHCIEWIRERGYYYADKRSTFYSCAVAFLVFMICSLTVIFILFFSHMIHSLRKDSSKRSMNAIKVIQQSIINLFMQLILPLFLFVVPALVVTLSLLFEDLFSFETVFIFYRVLPLHSIGHNIILISISSAYRTLISSFMRRYLLCLRTSVPKRSFYVPKTVIPFR